MPPTQLVVPVVSQVIEMFTPYGGGDVDGFASPEIDARDDDMQMITMTDDCGADLIFFQAGKAGMDQSGFG